MNRNMNKVLFADDTSVSCTVNSKTDLNKSMLETLEKVHEYLNENKFVITNDKTERIVIEEENPLEKKII